eukprot:TRINITY_DN43520_c0_g1_i1.p1 TRINITY_DN43520_c0_g1~~TRINITY_DN43520_c0_g1_i1.p1  ORF type:complete len:419 (+),score=161.27 TRINITY_DN43520_c0_g1_i1:62-1318(+)
MFNIANLKAQAQRAAQQVSEQAQATYKQGKERLETGLAGKKLLDDGGQPMEAYLLAKKASHDARVLDGKLSTATGVLIDAYDSAVQRMEAVSEKTEQAETPEAQQIKACLGMHKAKTAELKKVLNSRIFDACPLEAAANAVERDAISILATKRGVMGVRQSVVDVAADPRKLTGGYGAAQPVPAAPVDSNVPHADAALAREGYAATPGGPPPTAAAASSSGTISDKAKEVVDAGKQRIGVLQAGKKISDEASQDEWKNLVILAKKAMLDAFQLDEKFVALFKQTISAWDDAAEKTTNSVAYDKDPSRPKGVKEETDEAAAADNEVVEHSFENLRSDYARRAHSLKEAFVKEVESIPAPAPVSPEEKDAISILTAKMAAMDVQQKAMGAASAAAGAATAAAAVAKDVTDAYCVDKKKPR